MPPDQPDNSGGPLGWLKKAMEHPRFPVAFGIVLLYLLLFYLFIYMFMGHVIFVNIPPPEAIPQAVLDIWHSMGVDAPSPTPAPAYIMGTDALNYTTNLLVIVGVLVLASWPIVTFALYLLTKIFGGTGKYFPDMVAAIGYTYIPKVLAVIAVILLVTQLPVFKVDVSQLNINDLVQGVNSTAFPLLARGLLLAGLLSSCLLGVVAVRYSGRVGWVAATLVVGIPLVLYLAYTYL